MITRLNLSIPLNQLSLAQVSFNILRELYRRKIQCVIHPKGGNVDLSAYKIDPQFGSWIQQSVNNRYKKVDRKVPTLSVWHIGDSHFKPSDKQYLFSFHETDSPTEEEINIVNQQEYTFFSSSWTVDNFRQYGVAEDKVGFVPLGFDQDIITTDIPLEYTHWICVGKWEDLRKMTGLKLRAWIKRYGGNPKHQLTICVDNPFYQKRIMSDGRIEGFDMNDVYTRFFGASDWQRTKPFNVNVLSHLRTNAEINRLYNSADIDLSGISRAEGWNLPAFNVTALGKWSIVTDCSAHKDWANDTNAILVKPTGMMRAVDGLFFHDGQPFSQGNMFDFSEDSLVEAFEKAEKKAKTPNEEGVTLQKTHTWAKTVDRILEVVGE